MIYRYVTGTMQMQTQALNHDGILVVTGVTGVTGVTVVAVAVAVAVEVAMAMIMRSAHHISAHTPHIPPPPTRHARKDCLPGPSAHVSQNPVQHKCKTTRLHTQQQPHSPHSWSPVKYSAMSKPTVAAISVMISHGTFTFHLTL